VGIAAANSGELQQGVVIDTDGNYKLVVSADLQA